MSASFASLNNSYRSYNRLDTSALYESLGWGDLVDRPEWQNTCAVRMHLALLDANVQVPGRFPVLKGTHAGSRIEVSQQRLAEKIERSGRFGSARVYSREEFLRKDGYKDVAGQTGIVSFQRMPGYPGGHIDLLDARSDWNCLRQCYFNSGQIHFWQVP